MAERKYAREKAAFYIHGHPDYSVTTVATFFDEEDGATWEPRGLTEGSGGLLQEEQMNERSSGKRAITGRWLGAGALAGSLVGLVALASPTIAIGMMAAGAAGYALLDIWPHRRV